MKLAMEQVGVVISHIVPGICEKLTDEIEKETGHELDDAQYVKMADHVTDSLTEVLAGVEV